MIKTLFSSKCTGSLYYSESESYFWTSNTIADVNGTIIHESHSYYEADKNAYENIEELEIAKPGSFIFDDMCNLKSYLSKFRSSKELYIVTRITKTSDGFLIEIDTISSSIYINHTLKMYINRNLYESDEWCQKNIKPIINNNVVKVYKDKEVVYGYSFEYLGKSCFIEIDSQV